MDYIELNTEIQQLITSEQAWHYTIVPKKLSGNKLFLYVSDDQDIVQVQNELEVLLSKEITLEPVESDIVKQTISRYYRRAQKNNKVIKKIEIDKQSEDFIVEIINEAHQIGSSDIHIETYEEKCRIRLRIDGKLIERYSLKKDEYPAIINKIKIRANIDIAEKRLPQDGRIYFETEYSRFDIRVSVLPTLYGEKIVLRLLSKDSTYIDIEGLGFNPEQIRNYHESIKKPHGIVLISGPTGSGKTTTLYATLKLLNKTESNILTIEDPVEYTLDGINQVQLKESIGLTFAAALRTFLRQDPDIIMLGEIRDGETAQMAIRAALTGHLVLSTIHTNSAWGTISRLIDMGVPAYLAASTLNVSVAQRLVRLLCPECKKPEMFNTSSYPKSYQPPKKIESHFRPVGCNSCYHTGYKGRKAVYEVIPIDYELAENIKHNIFDIRDYIQKNQVKLLHHSAFEMFENGETTIEEIYPILMNT
jgi:general secretion pathway protein E/type IV pilus assembly protein PilB